MTQTEKRSVGFGRSEGLLVDGRVNTRHGSIEQFSHYLRLARVIVTQIFRLCLFYSNYYEFKTLYVWDYFTRDKNDKFKCNLCSTFLSIINILHLFKYLVY